MLFRRKKAVQKEDKVYSSSYHKRMFTEKLAEADPQVYDCIAKELARQQGTIELIASENIVSSAVLEAQGSVLTNKYAEGYPHARYYGGCEYVDQVETLAVERAKKIFNAGFVNVQPHSGSQANQAVFLGLLNPYDKILSLSLDCGGHLTHGSSVNQSGKWFEAIHYSVHEGNGLIDYEQVSILAKRHLPKLIIAGCSAYPRNIDFAYFRQAADEIGAYLMVDMAHFAGLVAARLYNDPLPYAHIVTTTTHKTLRGPRGGMILTNYQDIAKLINSAVFPGLQGGPLMHVIAAKAVAFGEALTSKYRKYMRSVLKNARILAKTLSDRGYSILTDGTDCHLLLVNLRFNGLTGKEAEKSLERAGLTCNKNSIPFDTERPTVTSGIRIGTPAGTTRGFSAKEFKYIGNLIADVLSGLQRNIDNVENNKSVEEKVLAEVKRLCKDFPIY
ncbi:serine hydroxymethyltransferase [Alphaproteobacteria bacterium]